MNLKIESVNIHPREGLVDRIEQKVEKILAPYNFVTDTIVFLKANKSDQKKGKIVEIKVNVVNETLFAKEEESTFEKSFDEAFSKIKRQLDRYKQKIHSKS